MQVTLLAEYLCNLQPISIRDRLLHDQTFGARMGLGSRLVLGLGGDLHVDQQSFIARMAKISERIVLRQGTPPPLFTLHLEFHGAFAHTDHPWKTS